MLGVVAIAFVLAVVGLKSVIVVPADAVYVVERLGRYHRTIRSGMHVLTPFLDRIAFRYTLKPKDAQLTDRCITRDNIPVSVTSSFRWEVVDPQAAAYNSANVAHFVVELIRSRQRQWIGERAWNDVRENTRDLQKAVLSAIAEPVAHAGVKISDMRVDEITSGAPASRAG
ncbi:MAG: SPFH domain-containing protein [Thermoanaerobaculia bacterium]